MIYFDRSDTDLCFDQAEFITGFTLCAHVEYLPLNSTDNAMWPLQGNDNIQLKLEMVDAITFKAEFDNKGECFGFLRSFNNNFNFSLNNHFQRLENLDSISITTHRKREKNDSYR